MPVTEVFYARRGGTPDKLVAHSVSGGVMSATITDSVDLSAAAMGSITGVISVGWDGTSTLYSSNAPSSKVYMGTGSFPSSLTDSQTSVLRGDRGISSVGLAGSDTLTAKTTKLYRTSGQLSATIVDSLDESATDNGATGISCDGTNAMFFGYQANKAYLVPGVFDGGALLDSFTYPQPAGYLGGISWDGTNVWGSHTNSDTLYRFTGWSGTVADTLPLGTNEPTGVDIDDASARVGAGGAPATPAFLIRDFRFTGGHFQGKRRAV